MNDWSSKESLCSIFQLVRSSFLYVSFLSVLLITVDRWFSIRFPFIHRARQTKKNKFIIMAGVWLLSASLHAISIHLWHYLKNLPSTGEQDILNVTAPCCYSSAASSLINKLTSQTSSVTLPTQTSQGLLDFPTNERLSGIITNEKSNVKQSLICNAYNDGIVSDMVINITNVILQSAQLPNSRKNVDMGWILWIHDQCNHIVNESVKGMVTNVSREQLSGCIVCKAPFVKNSFTFALYCLAYFPPLLAIWLLNISLYCKIKERKSANVRRSININNSFVSRYVQHIPSSDSNSTIHAEFNSNTNAKLRTNEKSQQSLSTKYMDKRTTVPFSESKDKLNSYIKIYDTLTTSERYTLIFQKMVSNKGLFLRHNNRRILRGVLSTVNCTNHPFNKYALSINPTKKSSEVPSLLLSRLSHSSTSSAFGMESVCFANCSASCKQVGQLSHVNGNYACSMIKLIEVPVQNTMYSVLDVL